MGRTPAAKIVGSALAAVAAASLVFGASTPAAAVLPHKHCLLTPEGWVLIAEGVSEEAPNDPALEAFHDRVHTGVPGSGGEPLTIARIDVDQDCSQLPLP
jgi:hypothetical protein